MADPGPTRERAGANLGPTWANLGQLGPTWAILGHLGSHLGAILDHLGPSWGHLGAILELKIVKIRWTNKQNRLLACHGRVGAILDILGLLLGPSWGHLGLSWAHLGDIGAILR